MKRVEGKRAVVTGGAQGIGAAIARRLAAEGAIVAVLDINIDGARQVLPAPHVGIACDVSDTASVDHAFAEVRAALGGVDILVNNAARGSAPGDGLSRYFADLAERQAQIARGEQPTVFADYLIHCEDSGWLGVIDLALNSVFRCSRAAVRLMVEEGVAGNIVNISSTVATRADGGSLPYIAAKAGVLGLTRGMARELADRGIRVNAVVPGGTETPIYESVPADIKAAIAADNLLKRLADPDEVASAVAFLAGSDGTYATGSTVTVNGGGYFT